MSSMDKIDKTFIRALFTQEYYKGYRIVDSYMCKVVSGILDDLDISRYLREDYRTVDGTMKQFGFHGQSRALLFWALRYLEETGFAKSRDGAYVLSAGPRDTDTTEDVRSILELVPSTGIFIQLVAEIRRDMGNFFHGRKNVGDILFTGKALSLWNGYFNNKFYGYSVLNYGAAYGITKWFSGTRGKEMLEIGSGTSGATVRVFQMLRSNNLLDSMDGITVSDVVPALLELGKRNIEDNILPPPRYRQKILDVTRPFTEQGVPEESLDILYGVNVLHVAHDLGFTLREIYTHLREDGVLVVAETVRPYERRPMHHEIIAELIPGYYEVKTDPRTRPYHGFLTRELWVKNLEAAGFRDIECITELESHDGLDFDIRPSHSFLVIKGRK